MKQGGAEFCGILVIKMLEKVEKSDTYIPGTKATL
jgi:hypothetical protein